MYKIYNQSELKNKNMTPTKTTLLAELKQFAIIIAVIMGIALLLTVAEDKSKLTPIQPNINAQAQSEKVLTSEQEIDKLKLQLDIKQKQAELQKLDPKASALK